MLLALGAKCNIINHILSSAFHPSNFHTQNKENPAVVFRRVSEDDGLPLRSTVSLSFVRESACVITELHSPASTVPTTD